MPDIIEALQNLDKHPVDEQAQTYVELPKVPEETTVAEKMQELAATEREVLALLRNKALQYDKLMAIPAVQIALQMSAELTRGDIKHGTGIQWPTNSVSHEAYGVLLEEVDELWDEVKRRVIDRDAMRKEAIQVGAMAIRFVRNVCDTNPDTARPEPEIIPRTGGADTSMVGQSTDYGERIPAPMPADLPLEKQ